MAGAGLQRPFTNCEKASEFASVASKLSAMANLCHACESAPVEVIDSCDDANEPYRVCSACHRRLHARALRPLEWYNLAKCHGWYAFLLHDDFYNEDGSADQPEEEVEESERFPVPSLAAVSGDPDQLLDYTVTRWHLRGDVEEAWKTLNKAEALSVLTRRFIATRNAGIRSCILNVCALALQETAANFVREVWELYPAEVTLSSLAKASAACLPENEGLSRVIEALDALKGSQKRDLMYCLKFFHSPAGLDWIERSVYPPITNSWGYLAAECTIDWQRVDKWLESGRPLSLVALDALSAILAYPTRPHPGKWQLRLHNPPRVEVLRDVLRSHAKRDAVPRVESQTESILRHAEELCSSGIS